MTLTEILRQCKRNDTLAWERFVRDYQGRIYRIAFTYARNPEDAGDLTQEIFIRIYRKIGQWREDESAMAWILTIARNLGIDHVRRGKVRAADRTVPVDEHQDIADPRQNPVEECMRDSRRRILQKALESLSEISREIVLLKDMQGLSLDDIARMLGIPLGTAKSRSNRARSELVHAVLALSSPEQLL